jgi:peptidoglycan/LPS O-acetylase OafA/YrhL
MSALLNTNPGHRAGGDRIYIIDLLRFLAAAGVVIYHWCFRGPEVDHISGVVYAELSGQARYLNLGVRLFFMISGFVICYSAAGKTALQFGWSRFVRLFPTYWLCATLSWVLLSLLSPGMHQLSFWGYLVNLTMLQQYFNVGHVDPVYYTLLQELRFYALIFAVLLFGQQKRLLWLVTGWMGLSLVDFFLKVPLAHYEMVLDDAPYFAGGVVCYLIFRDGARLHHWLLLAGCYGLGLARFLRHSMLEQGELGIVLSPGLLALYIALIFAVMIAISLRKLSLNGKGWTSPLGGMSYPLYLLHNYIGVMMVARFGSMLNRWVLLAWLFVSLCALSYAVWRWFEVPAMGWLQGRFGPYFRPRPVAVVAVEFSFNK